MVRTKRIMDITFYDEQPFYAGNSASNINNNNNNNNNNGPNYMLPVNLNNNNNIGRANNNNNNNNLKLQLTLDLNNHHYQNQYQNQMQLQNNQSKRLKFMDTAPVLSSPDLNMCKLPSPEMEKLIAQTSTQDTPTPTSIVFPRTVTQEQEMYARGFVDALNDLHHTHSHSHSSSNMGSPNSTATYTNLDQQSSVATSRLPMPSASSSPQSTTLPTSLTFADNPNFAIDSINGNVVIKEEPQTVPSLGGSPPVSPIDMESQERIKLERKRLRNRLAASKCRRRKLERISRLEDKVKHLKNENAELSVTINRLREHVCHLKEQVMDHMNAGCQIIPSSFL